MLLVVVVVVFNTIMMELIIQIVGLVVLKVTMLRAVTVDMRLTALMQTPIQDLLEVEEVLHGQEVHPEGK
jgi:hypothetical protein